MEKTNYDEIVEIKKMLIELTKDLEKMLDKEPTLHEYAQMHACAVRAGIAADDLMQTIELENAAKDVELGTFDNYTL
jgi:hypothetical protein